MSSFPPGAKHTPDRAAMGFLVRGGCMKKRCMAWLLAAAMVGNLMLPVSAQELAAPAPAEVTPAEVTPIGVATPEQAAPTGELEQDAVAQVQGMLDALPTLEELQAMTAEEQAAAYMQIQKAYDACEALTEEEQAQLNGAAALEELLLFFTGLVTPLLEEGHNGFDANGFCVVNGCTEHYKEAEKDQTTGVYQIGNAGQLYWFADKVNNENATYGTANAKLTANIEVNQNVLNDDGTLNGDGAGFKQWTPIGKYEGTFDGDGHTISGLYFDGPDWGEVGLFGRIQKEGIIQNVGVINSYIKGGKWVGGVCGYNAEGTIQNCYNEAIVEGTNNDASVGGVCGHNYYGTVKNCFNAGTVTGSENLTINSGIGGVCGYSDGYLLNCYNRGMVTRRGNQAAVGAVCGWSSWGANKIQNCYYLDDGETDKFNGTAFKNEEKFETGEVAWLLNGSSNESATTGVWGQEIDSDPTATKDPYPVLNGPKVYKDGETYTNTDPGAVTYIEQQKYEQGQLNGVEGIRHTGEYTKLTNADTFPMVENVPTLGEAGETKWYTVDSTFGVTERIEVLGDVHLILKDGCTLTASKGINVEGDNKLTIYSQHDDATADGVGQNGSGKLVAIVTKDGDAAIGSSAGTQDNVKTTGTITIHGGNIEATGKPGGAGIGGGFCSTKGTVCIYGGTVVAKAGGNNTGSIGCGNNGAIGKIEICGGNITAEFLDARMAGGGIGGCTVGTIAITGGKVYAEGSRESAGIGGRTVEKISITGGDVTAKGGRFAAGIGGFKSQMTGIRSKVDEIIITGDAAVVNATGGDAAPGIGSSNTDTVGTITISGGEVVAKGGGTNPITDLTEVTSAGIGGNVETISITGGSVTATGGSGGVGIGGNAGTISIADDTTTVKATGGSNNAGIGGNVETISITGGSVTATGGEGDNSGVDRSGIGGNVKTISITGGTVTATAQGLSAEDIFVREQTDGQTHRIILAGNVKLTKDTSVFAGGSGGNVMNLLKPEVWILPPENGFGNGKVQVISIDWENLIGVMQDKNAAAGDPYQVCGNAKLPVDYTIPEGMTWEITSGATLTVPENITLTNNGTIKGAICTKENLVVERGGKLAGNVPEYTHDPERPANGYENGFCTTCGAYQPADLNDGVYEISNAGQLYWFAQQVNGGQKNIDAKLTADIVVNENVLVDGQLNTSGNFRAWTPIGSASRPYQGTFDGINATGGCHTIKGLYYKSESDSADYVGLFGFVSGGTVKNVGVVDSYLKGHNWVGGVCGFAVNSTLENCYNTGTVEGAGSTGGVCGENGENSTIKNCYNTGAVTGSAYDIGGVCGESGENSTIENCNNTGAVSGDENVGGVCGWSFGDISSCTNTGAVSGNDTVGGVCGLSEDNSTIQGCHNEGKVTGGSKVGGVCGDNEGALIECDHKTGEVIGAGDQIGGVCGQSSGTIADCRHETGKVEGAGHVGGVCGYSFGDISNCANTGNVSGTGTYIGGVCGWIGGNVGNAITGCHNEGTVSGSSYVGGVCGFSKSAIQNCYNTGEVSGNGSEIGGVCGYSNGAIQDCYNAGGILVQAQSNYAAAGGVCGHGESGTIKNCYNTGTVNASGYLAKFGGVCGFSMSAIQNCYNTGDISVQGDYTNPSDVCGTKGGTITNCYYLADGETDTFDGTTYKTGKQFASGEVAWLLNQNNADPVWRQTLNKDPSPNFTGARVYRHKDGSYHNPGDEQQGGTQATPKPTATPAPSATPAPQSAAAVTIPQTGDDSNPTLWVVLMLGALAGLGGIGIYKKKKRDDGR